MAIDFTATKKADYGRKVIYNFKMEVITADDLQDSTIGIDVSTLDFVNNEPCTGLLIECAQGTCHLSQANSNFASDAFAVFLMKDDNEIITSLSNQWPKRYFALDSSVSTYSGNTPTTGDLKIGAGGGITKSSGVAFGQANGMLEVGSFYDIDVYCIKEFNRST